MDHLTRTMIQMEELYIKSSSLQDGIAIVLTAHIAAVDKAMAWLPMSVLVWGGV